MTEKFTPSRVFTVVGGAARGKRKCSVFRRLSGTLSGFPHGAGARKGLKERSSAGVWGGEVRGRESRASWVRRGRWSSSVTAGVKVRAGIRA